MTPTPTGIELLVCQDIAARRIVEIMMSKAGAVVWCLHANEASSRVQQALIYKDLPAEFRQNGSSKVKIYYSSAGGFTENMFSLPNGSKCYFRFYTQDVKTVDREDLDAVWSDAPAPLSWGETIKCREYIRTYRELPMTPAPTGIELLVCQDIAARQQQGILKYGTTVQGNPLELREWLVHAYQESLDYPIYLRRAIDEIDRQHRDDGTCFCAACLSLSKDHDPT